MLSGPTKTWSPYGLQTPGVLRGPRPNGSGERTLINPSSGTGNTASGLASVSALRINEWMADSADGSDWFEIFNSAHGDAVILSQADAAGNLTRYRSQVDFGAAANGVPFGRYAISAGLDFTALSTHTFGVDAPTTVEQYRLGRGRANAAPGAGPLVVSEIQSSLTAIIQSSIRSPALGASTV